MAGEENHRLDFEISAHSSNVCYSFIHFVLSSFALVCLLLCSKNKPWVFKESGIYWEVDSAMWCESQKVIPDIVALNFLKSFLKVPSFSSSFPSSLHFGKRR